MNPNTTDKLRASDLITVGLGLIIMGLGCEFLGEWRGWFFVGGVVVLAIWYLVTVVWYVLGNILGK